MPSGFEKMKGLVVAPFTPMHNNGDINLSVIDEQSKLFRKYHIAGVFVCGTTGESLSLTLEERKSITERWARFTDEQMRLIVHVGHECLRDAQSLARHAQEIGAWAIGSIAPTYFKPRNIDELVDYCRELASAAPELPFYYYHIPSLTGLNFSMYEFLQKAIDRIPSLVGIKFTYEDLLDFGLCLEYQNRKFDMLFGRDEIMASALAAGAKAFVGSFYNFAAPLFHEIINEFDKGNIQKVQRLQARAQEFTAIFKKYGGNVATAKAIMKIAGLDCGPTPLPVKPLSEEQIALLARDLQTIDFHDYTMKMES